MVCKHCGKDNLETIERCAYCKENQKNRSLILQSIINVFTMDVTKDIKNIKDITAFQSTSNRKERYLYIIAILTVLFQIGLFIGGIVFFDTIGMASAIFVAYALPFTLSSIIGAIAKLASFCIVGSVYFFCFNIILLFLTTSKDVLPMNIICIVFSMFIFFLTLQIKKSKGEK